ncbi:MAG: hypothetical protein LBR34_05760 [Prevotella sp.]|nr:hypothetical protein [Prevotella sp.]
MKKQILVLAVAATCFTACREDIPQLNRPEDWLFTDKAADEFEMYWSAMNHNYVFWDVDTTDWDEVYRTYKPKFEALDNDTLLSEEDKRVGAFELYKELTSTLVDGHYAILFNDGTSIYPSGERNKDKTTPVLWLKYTDEFLSVCRKRMKEPVFFEKTEADGETTEFLAASGLIEVNGGTVPYFFFSAFSLLENFAVYDDLVSLFGNFRANTLRPDVKGIIIDVRGNGGGDAREPGFILGYLADREFTFAYTRSKAGEGRLDYTPWTPFRVIPQEGAIGFTVPIIILADINSVSCSELITMGVKALPNGNGVSIGKTTHGGHGALILNAAYNGGQFTTLTFFNSQEYSQYVRWVYTSSEMTKTAFDGKVYEGKGLPPDIDVDLDIDRYMDGYDTQLERAIDYINSSN